MALVRRCIQFGIHESFWWPTSLLGLVAVTAWKFWGSELCAQLFAGMSVAFFAPWVVRRRVVLKYATCRRFLVNAGIGIACAMVLLRFSGHSRLAIYAFAYYLSFTVGFLFWTVTDDCYTMVNWLSHPLEYGRPPDAIYLLAKRHDKGEVNRLWKYRYDDEWDVGITGTVTFAFEDGRCNSMSPDEIFDAYLGWYVGEGIEGMMKKAACEDNE